MKHLGLLSAVTIAAWIFGQGSAAAELLPPFKDDVFALPALLDTTDGGARLVFDYREMRDVNGRDAVPERRAHARYVDLGVRSQQAELLLQTQDGPLRFFAVGNRADPRFAVVYIHGQGGSGLQGVDDHTFGGNFNRIKNLVNQAGGVYLSPDVGGFDANGASRIAALIEAYLPQNGIPVFVACGSAGGAICWELAKSAELAPRLGGLLLLGSHWNDGFSSSPAFARRVPVLIAHGSNDRVFPVDRQETFFRSILARDGSYPVRFARFESGSHGTPIRMVDWRQAINWMTEVPR